MSKRKLVLVGVAAVIAVSLFAYLTLAPRVTEGNYQQIHDGMVLAEVEALLGPPAERSNQIVYALLCSGGRTLRDEYGEEADEEAFWEDGGGMILVGFKGTVIYKRFDPQRSESPLDKFHRWFGTAHRSLVIAPVSSPDAIGE